MSSSLFSHFVSKKESEELTLVVDIGSASVGAAFVKIGQTVSPHVVSSARMDISFQDTLSSSRFLQAMLHALDGALRALESNLKPTSRVTNVFCTLSSPWFILKTRNIHVVREQEFEVTQQALEAFIDQDIEKLKGEMKAMLPLSDVAIIEKKIIHIKLNGYEIKNPYKQITSRMELTATLGVSSRKVMLSLEHRIQKFFHSKNIHFGVFPVATFGVIRDMFPQDENFLFLDITGETTDLTRIENGVLVNSLMFPYGKNSFVRAISGGLRTIHQEASSIFMMYLRKELDPARTLQVGKIIRKVELEWLAKFEKSATALSQGAALPRKLFFISDIEVESLFTLLVGQSTMSSLMKQNFDIQYLDQLIVSKFVTFDNETKRDPFLVIETLFAQKILAQHL